MYGLNFLIIPIILISLYFKLRAAYLISLISSLAVATFIFAKVSLPNILFTIAIFNVSPLVCRLFTLRLQRVQLSLEKKKSGAQAAVDALRKERSLIEESTLELNEEVAQIAELYRITRSMSEVLGFAEIFAILGKKLMESLRFKRARLVLIDEDVGLSKISKVWEFKYGCSQASPVNEEVDDAKMLQQSMRRQKVNYIEEKSTTLASLMAKGKFLGTVMVEDLPATALENFSILANQFCLEFKRIRLYQKIQQLAITDGLTSLYVRRYFLERMDEELRRSTRHRLKLAFLMIDIDHFKQCNDKYGHLTGDVVLSEIAKIIKANVREIDLVARYGGEEFSVLLPDTDKLGAGQVAERIRLSVESHQFRAYDETIKPAVSIGVAGFPDDADQPQSLIDKSDQALYRAKQAGRNRVEIF